MWTQTLVSKLLKIQYPIIQAPMAGGITTPELVAAISNAGGLGSLGAGYMKPETILHDINKIRSLTDKPFAVNLFIPEKSQATKKQINKMTNTIKKVCVDVIKKIPPIKMPDNFLFDEQIAVLIAEKIPIFSFTFGCPSRTLINKLKKANMILIGTATTVAEAILLEKNNIDMVVAQGFEAGGHRGTFLKENRDALIGNFALIPQLVDYVKIPVIAAGGIMDARGIIAALALGASAVQMGTAFLATNESGAHSLYKKTLLKTKMDNTTLTAAFTGKLARGIKNKFIQEMELYQDNFLDYPLQHLLTRPMREQAAKLNIADFMSMWSGQGAYLAQKIHAEKLLSNLVNEVSQQLKNFKNI